MVEGDRWPRRWLLLKWLHRGRRKRAAMSMRTGHLWLSREAGAGSKCVEDSMRGHLERLLTVLDRA